MIVAAGTPAALSAKGATATIPISFMTAADPVLIGLVASLSRPDANLTGVACLKSNRYARKRDAVAQMFARRLPPGRRLRCYRDQSQNPPNDEVASRAYARPAALRPSLTAAARPRQSSCRSSRQKESLPVSLRRELALRTVFSAFFGGDELARPSVAPVRVSAFSGVAPRTSALAGTAARVLQSSVRSSCQKESLSMSSRRELAVRTVFCTFFWR